MEFGNIPQVEEGDVLSRRKEWTLISTPKLATDVERGLFLPDKVMLVMGVDWIWFGLQTMSLNSLPEGKKMLYHTAVP